MSPKLATKAQTNGQIQLAGEERTSRSHRFKIHLGIERCQTSQQHVWYSSKQVKGQSFATAECSGRPDARTLSLGAGGFEHVLLNVTRMMTQHELPAMAQIARHATSQQTSTYPTCWDSEEVDLRPHFSCVPTLRRNCRTRQASLTLSFSQ